MMDWQLRLEGLVQRGGEIPPPGNTFSPPKPIASPWPKGLPTNAALTDFYARCNGCIIPSPIGVFLILPRGKLAAASRRWRGKLRDVTDEDRPLGDAVVVLGDDDAGCLAWDPDTDRLYHFEMDDGAAEPLPDKSLHDFFERVFDPERAVGPAAAEWATALRWLEVNA